MEMPLQSITGDQGLGTCGREGHVPHALPTLCDYMGPAVQSNIDALEDAGNELMLVDDEEVRLNRQLPSI